MAFEAAWVWWLAPLLAVHVLWMSRRSYAQLAPPAARASLVVRLVVLLLLVGALSRPSAWTRHHRSELVFLLDVSRSVTAENLEAALEDIDRLASAAARSGRETTLSVAAFGEHATLLVRSERAWNGWPDEMRERILYQTTLPKLYAQRTERISAGDGEGDGGSKALDQRIAAVESFRDGVAGEHTDLERGLRLALNCGSIADPRTVYLFSDCNLNHGRTAQALNEVERSGTALHLVRLDRPLPAEVAATDVVLPPRVRVNQGFSAQVHVASTVETDATLSLFKDGFAVQRRKVSLHQGGNAFPVSGLFFHEKGFHTVEASVTAEADTKLENNTARSLVVVPGQARVLYVDGDEDQIPYLKSALELEGMQVEARPAAGVPDDLSQLLSFAAFILSNVPADRLSLRQMEMIRTYVRDSGGGFIMLGGDESFGLGGYFNTPVEDVLPVRMPIQKDMIRPSLALMLVIDKSGSMEGVKIQLAKRAAVATADAINPRDQIGVIGFDGEARVLLELTPASDRATVASKISELDAGGGTFLYPALQAAQARLQGSDARRKHVIVLSDGQTQGFGYDELAQNMAMDGVTVSAVGIGEGADMNLLESVALAGGGRAYFTNDFYSIPQIFTREALRASNNMLVERLVQPIVIEDDASLEEIDTDELPLLTGYVATTPKPAARLLMVSDSGDPLLAAWRYGLGRSAAFTSETKPRWAEDWLDWPDFAKFWSQLVRSVAGQELGRTLTVECTHALDDRGMRLVAEVRDAGGELVDDVGLELSALGRAGGTRALSVSREGPGLFEASVPRIAYGEDQQFVWSLKQGEADPHAIPYGIVYAFSPEFRTLGADTNAFERLAERKLGKTMSVGHSDLSLSTAGGRSAIQLWPYLIAAALILIPFDILCRRLG